MPQLTLRAIENKDTGKGFLEILEQKTVICRARVGIISYDNPTDKKQLINSLLDNGKNGQFLG